MRQQLNVYSFFPYSKKGEADAVTIIADILLRTKNCRLSYLDKYFTEFLDTNAKTELLEFIPPNSTLIPIPRSAPLVENAQWPSRDICEYLLKYGYGNNYLPILKRIKAVPKAAFQINSADRPSVKLHYDSITTEKNTIFGSAIEKIVLVDDIITQGRVSYASYQRIFEAFPDIPISIFSLIRTITFEKIDKWNQPQPSELVYYPQSGRTRHILSDIENIGGLWSI